MDNDLESILKIIDGLVPEGVDAYVVGGTVRDMLMARQSADVDVAVSSGAGALARDMALKLGGSAFVMDDARDVHRVALASGTVSHVDISRLNGDIAHDLSARDFTINAMAVPVAGFRVQGSEPIEVIDPSGGMADLKAGVIRVPGRDAFTDDPLRMLRAFRLAVTLDFTIEDATLSMVRELADRIAGVSPERVRDELYLILGADGAEDALRLMHSYGLLFRVIPELAPMEGLEQGEAHSHDLLDHSLRAVGHCEAVMADTERYFGDNAANVSGFMRGRADGAACMSAVVKLCALLHDSGKPSSLSLEGGRPRFFGHDEAGAATNAGIADRLRLSERARATLSRTAALHMRPLNLSRDGLTRRAAHRLARDAGELLPALGVLALSDALATRERPDELFTDVEGTVRLLTDYYYGDYTEAARRPLLRGGDLMDELGLPQGPEIGRILRVVEEKRAEGMLCDREGALGYVREHMESWQGRKH